MKYLKFEASWCGACKMIKPTLRKVEEAGIQVEVVDAEHNTELVTKFNIKNLPTVILVDDSHKEYYRFAGTRATSEEYLNIYQQFANV
tara:strand:- start:816 stop:1079 length:264 start_codon:yes stop_codon:yes gene_type:complete